MNRQEWIGHVVSEPEMKNFDDDKCVLRIRLAVNGRTKDDDSIFINLSAWNKRAEVLKRYLHKGDLFAAVTSLKQRQYTDKNGSKVTGYDFAIEDFDLIAPKRDRHEDF